MFANMKCFGIFAPLYTNNVNIKRKITRRLVLQLAIFTAVIGLAMCFDIYFKDSKVDIAGIETNSPDNSKDQNTVHLISQSMDLGVKTYAQKIVVRKVQLKSHDKYIQKYYQLRNYQVLKAEVQKQTTPLINSYHYLAYKNYFFTNPDDIPLIS